MKIGKFILSSLLFLLALNVQASIGYLYNDPFVTSHQALVCKDATCTSPTPGIINFKAISPSSLVIDSVTGLSGQVWGNELGWITLNPTGQGVYFSNPVTGLLGGYAWSGVTGWINFGVTGQPLYIEPLTGKFRGWAWAGGAQGGWIKFDCANVSSCVTTTWRSFTQGGGGGAYALALADVCPNLEGIQNTIPPLYTVNEIGSCVPVVDQCPNLDGEQTTIPNGYKKDSMGACVPSFIDYCPNIAGNQSGIPSGNVVDDSGNCVIQPNDFCPNVVGVQTSYEECNYEVEDACTNLPGFQTKVPSNYSISSGICYPITFDICPNLSGNQTDVPNGYIISQNGNCVVVPSDVCRNLAGPQRTVPEGYYRDGGSCFFGEKPAVDSSIADPIIEFLTEPFFVNPFSPTMFSTNPFFVKPAPSLPQGGTPVVPADQTQENDDSTAPAPNQIFSKIVTAISDTYDAVVYIITQVATWINERVTSFFNFIVSLFGK